MSNTRYYQIGGFRPDIRWFKDDWQDKQLFAFITAPNSPLLRSYEGSTRFELVLGIKRSGTSHLLITDQHRFPPQYRWPYNFTTAANYESVSPIYFDSAEDLKKKMAVLKPKPRKSKKSKEEEPMDTSQANKSYVGSASTLEQGRARGQFENGRLVYNLLKNTIQPAIYSIADDDIYRIRNLRIVSFACNLRAVDMRPYDERQRLPRPLDFGWAEAETQMASGDILSLKPNSAAHVLAAEDRLLGTGRRKADFRFGTTQVVPRKEAEITIRTFFEGIKAKNQPTILLVHDETLCRNALQEAAVDTSSWNSGLGELLRSKLQPTNKYHSFSSRTSYDISENRQNRKRERSRSPVRGHRGPSTKPRHPSPPPTAPGIYIVDVQTLYRTMMRTQNDSKILVNTASKLNVIQDENTWCAGNEAVLIFQVWHTMISGLAIDEQRAVWLRGQSTGASTIGSSPIRGQTAGSPSRYDGDNGDEAEDEEFDPNDIVQVSSGKPLNGVVGGGAAASDSETDYDDDFD